MAGEHLAVAWNDGVVRVLGLEGGKPVHQIRVSEGGDGGKIVFMSWTRHITGAKSSPVTQDGREKKRLVLDGERSGDGAVDLPRELVFLEIDTALPKLPPLAAAGMSGDDSYLFASTASMDAVFRPCRAEDADNVHVMIAGTAGGGIHLSIYDAFALGTLQRSPALTANLQLCGHSSRPESSTHMLLLRPPPSDDAAALYLAPLHLGFLSHSPADLALLTNRATVLLNLVRYLTLTHSQMVAEWQSTRELPGRFMGSLTEDLKKTNYEVLTVTQALYHAVATGHLFPAVQEWLVDVIGDRGYKRWERAVVAGLTSLRSLVHQSFLPALERCGVVLSRLLGIARFHGPEAGVGFDEAQIAKLLDIVACLTMVGHKVLTTVMDELEHFHAFAAWLRLEIDRQSSSASEELTEKEATMDTSKVLTYMQHFMVDSPLAVFFADVSKEDYAKDQGFVAPGMTLLELLDEQLREHEAGRPSMKVLPRVAFLLNYLSTKSAAVSRGIADAAKQRVKLGPAAELSVGMKIWKHSIWMGRTGKQDPTSTVFTAMTPEDDKGKIFLFRSLVPLGESLPSEPPTTACGLGLPDGVSIVDLEFLDDESLLVLCGQKEEPKSALLRIAYQAPAMPYHGYTAGQRPEVVLLDGSGSDGVSACVAFSDMAGFTPLEMEVQRASGRRGDVPARVCLLGRDRTVYKTYTVPESKGPAVLPG
ncbi:hypothetical protein VTJ83DRAFT_823 [Remersonia thermophila]|uniref:Anaphase-promoting complex subunit 4 n=1 Tax=Remersonia thermophila TaxID=72144 RepID=A0ABR4DMK2_9PEZI